MGTELEIIKKLTFANMLNYIPYIFFRIFMFFVALWPLRYIYVFSNILSFTLKNIIKYRYRIIRLNLDFCYPNLDSSQKKKIKDGIYINLSDIIIETIKGFTLPIDTLNERYTYAGANIVDNITKKGQSVIVAGGHIANWEWGVSTIGHPFDAPVYGIYKPVKNPYISNYIDRKRKRSGMLLCPISETRLAFQDHGSDGSIFLMLGDQNASNKKRAHWVNFLNNPTSCLHGVGHYAHKLDLEVFYLDVQRVKRGYYNAEIKLICANPQSYTPEEITGLYMKAVQDNININKSDWLWTHKRWKNTKSGHSLYD